MLATNRTARKDYFILHTDEAGIELRGTEVKSLRDRRVNMTEAFARIENLEIILYNLDISPYDKGNRFNHDPLRPRRLLLHKNEIVRLQGLSEGKGVTLIPLRLYLKLGRVKVELAVAKGKLQYDKREDVKRRDHLREITRVVSRMDAKSKRL